MTKLTQTDPACARFVLSDRPAVASPPFAGRSSLFPPVARVPVGSPRLPGAMVYWPVWLVFQELPQPVPPPSPLSDPELL